jgi:hypothetical protein
VRRLSVAMALGMLTVAGAAFAVSDGNYDPARQHCSGAANNVEAPHRVEDGCHDATVTVSDVGGHEYVGIGTQQTAEGERGLVPGALPFGLFSSVHVVDFWYDLGRGCTRERLDLRAPGRPHRSACPWLDPAAPNFTGPNPAPDPASGLRIYIGLDDNLAGGEHDSSELINNGPSDGGGIHVVLDPRQLRAWLKAFMARNASYVAAHPLPLGDAGLGFCADSICFSIQTERQVAYRGGDPNAPPHGVADYRGTRWDPEPCSGADDGSASTSCDDPAVPGTQDITYWHDQRGTAYVEPGVQIYADPDPQGSPIGPHPIPAIYVGTCGVIVGGGPAGRMPPSPFTDPATGQVIVGTACR